MMITKIKLLIEPNVSCVRSSERNGVLEGIALAQGLEVVEKGSPSRRRVQGCGQIARWYI